MSRPAEPLHGAPVGPTPPAAAGTGVRFEPRRYDDPLVTGLVEVLQQEFVRRYGGPDAAVVDPAEFAPPRGGFVVGLDAGGDAVVMGGFRDLGGGVAELKRMWVHPGARRRGHARAALAAVESAARAAGHRRLVLNCGTEQPEAIALYRSAGYEPTAPFGHYAHARGALFYGRDLTP